MGRVLPKTISEKEFIQILKAITYTNKNKEKKMKAAFTIAFYQCLRVSEVIKLQPNNIDRERGFIHILAGKGKKDGDIPIMAPAIKAFKFLPINYSDRTLQREIKYWGKEVLDKDIHFHLLRHSGATFYLNEKRVDVRHVQALLRHSRLQTTEIYTHVTPNALKDVFEDVWGGLE